MNSHMSQNNLIYLAHILFEYKFLKEIVKGMNIYVCEILRQSVINSLNGEH